MAETGSGTTASQIGTAQLLPFLLLSFGLAWGLFALFIFANEWVTQTFGDLSGRHPLFILAVYSPAIAALLLVGVSAGPAGIGRFLSRVLLWRASPWWYAFLFLGFPVISFAGAALKGNAMTAPLFTEPVSALLPAIGFMLILGPVEEIGWRGFALPILQRRVVPFWAGIILGVIWAVWHLPAFLLSGTPQAAWGFLPFFAGSVACSVILTACFNHARGSLLVAMLFHFQMNNPLWPDAQPYDMAVYVAAAVLIGWLDRQALFSQMNAVTAVIREASGGSR
jgi:membrane protease YdiL (CAAX protease family)